MSKHTPGPWSVVDGHYPSMREIQGPSFKINIVMSSTDINFQDYLSRSADARLIAAAPELLDALESVEREHELLSWMKNCELRRPRGSFGIAVESDELALEWQSHRNNLDKLAEARRAAIAKALGEE